jgi:hypothetical protein
MEEDLRSQTWVSLHAQWRTMHRVTVDLLPQKHAHWAWWYMSSQHSGGQVARPGVQGQPRLHNEILSRKKKRRRKRGRERGEGVGGGRGR